MHSHSSVLQFWEKCPTGSCVLSECRRRPDTVACNPSRTLLHIANVVSCCSRLG